MQDQRVSNLLRDVFVSSVDLMRSEIRLARAEMSDSARDIGRSLGQSVFYGIIVWLGVQSLVAFVIMALGEAMGGRYWLSALITGIVLIIPGTLLMLHSIRQAKNKGLQPIREFRTIASSRSEDSQTEERAS